MEPLKRKRSRSSVKMLYYCQSQEKTCEIRFFFKCTIPLRRARSEIREVRRWVYVINCNCAALEPWNNNSSNRAGALMERDTYC